MASVEAFQFRHSRVVFIDIDLMAQVIWICYDYNGTSIIPALCIIAKSWDFGTGDNSLWLQYCSYLMLNNSTAQLEMLKNKAWAISAVNQSKVVFFCYLLTTNAPKYMENLC